MILPDDVVKIVSAYSKPILRVDLLRKYKDSLEILGISSWPAIEEKLQTSEADEIIRLLVVHADATIKAQDSEDARDAITRKSHPKPKERRVAEDAADEALYADRRQKYASKTALSIALVGEEEFQELKRRTEAKEAEFERMLQADLDGEFERMLQADLDGEFY